MSSLYDLASLTTAFTPPQRQPLFSGIPQLDNWLKEQIFFGGLIEWGLPTGQNLHLLITPFLSKHEGLNLWVYNSEEKAPYPPSWAAWGVDLEQTYFVGCNKPVEKLKPLFFDNTFSLIVMDSLKLSLGDISFLSAKARELKKTVFLLRPYFLSPRRGNAFVSLRLNCEKTSQGFIIKPVKGRLTKPLSLRRQEVLCHSLPSA